MNLVTFRGLSGEMAVGLTVGESAQYVAFVELAAADMLELGLLALALSVAAYPTSDDAHAVDEPAQQAVRPEGRTAALFDTLGALRLGGGSSRTFDVERLGHD